MCDEKELNCSLWQALHIKKVGHVSSGQLLLFHLPGAPQSVWERKTCSVGGSGAPLPPQSPP